MKEQTLEFEETKKSAGSGLDLPDFVLGPRGVLLELFWLPTS